MGMKGLINIHNKIEEARLAVKFVLVSIQLLAVQMSYWVCKGLFGKTNVGFKESVN